MLKCRNLYSYALMYFQRNVEIGQQMECVICVLPLATTHPTHVYTHIWSHYIIMIVRLYLKSTEDAGFTDTCVTFELSETASEHVHMPQHLQSHDSHMTQHTHIL